MILIYQNIKLLKNNNLIKIANLRIKMEKRKISQRKKKIILLKLQEIKSYLTKFLKFISYYFFDNFF